MSNQSVSPAPAGICADFVPQASPIWIAKALYDYEATSDDELTITEDETLLVYDKEEDWSLVKSQTGKGIGFVPTAYIGEVGAAHVLRKASADHHPQGEDAEDEPPAAEPARIVVPDSVSVQYTHPFSTAVSRFILSRPDPFMLTLPNASLRHPTDQTLIQSRRGRYLSLTRKERRRRAHSVLAKAQSILPVNQTRCLVFTWCAFIAY